MHHCTVGVVVCKNPTCRFLDVPEGWVQVEKCDECNRFTFDFAAACSLFDNAKIVRCDEGGLHAIAEIASRFQ